MSSSSSVVTVADLRKHASKHKINLHGATTKKDILGHVKKHGSLNMVQRTKPISTKGKGSSKGNSKGSSKGSLKGAKKGTTGRRYTVGGGNCATVYKKGLADKLIEYVIDIRLAVRKLFDEESIEAINTTGNDMVRAAFALDNFKNDGVTTYDSVVNDLDCRVSAYIAEIKNAFLTRTVMKDYEELKNQILTEQNNEIEPLLNRVEELKKGNISELEILMKRLSVLKSKQ
jgi:hypothetical protein